MLKSKNKLLPSLLKCSRKKLIYFGKESNIHGLRYVAESTRHWLGRLFWLASLAMCSWGLWEILTGTLKAAQNDALSFTPDTNKLLWNTIFPAVTVCEKYDYSDTLGDIDRAFPAIRKKYASEYGIMKIIADVCFFDTYTSLTDSVCNPETFNCTFNWKPIIEKIRKPCDELIFNCHWRNTPINCCEHFLPIDTEYGTCYSFNTFQSRLSNTVPIYKSNRSTGPGTLYFSPNKDLDVYVHGNEDIPWIKSDMDMKLDVTEYFTKFVFNIIEMSNDPLVKTMDLNIRKCRFKDEVISNQFDKSYQIYGYSTCMTICKTELLYKECNCVHHLRDNIYRDLTCDYSGLLCIKRYSESNTKLEMEEVYCEHCLPSCEEIELTKLFYSEMNYQDYCGEDGDMVDNYFPPRSIQNPCYNDTLSMVAIEMQNLPNIKYRRNVVRTQLDLVVSIGGLAGLFFGASLLSVVEAMYFLFVRKLET